MSGWLIVAAVMLGMPMLIGLHASWLYRREQERRERSRRIRAQVRRIRDTTFYAQCWTDSDDRWLTDVGIKADL